MHAPFESHWQAFMFSFFSTVGTAVVLGEIEGDSDDFRKVGAGDLVGGSD